MQLYLPKDLNNKQHCFENLKCHIKFYCYWELTGVKSLSVRGMWISVQTDTVLCEIKLIKLERIKDTVLLHFDIANIFCLFVRVCWVVVHVHCFSLKKTQEHDVNKMYFSISVPYYVTSINCDVSGYVVCPSEKRFLLLFTFLKKNRKKKVMVFFSSCLSVKFHHELLNYIDLPVMSIHVRLLSLPQ